MDTRCLANVLTGEEREFFNTNGYLVVENALGEEMTGRLIDGGVAGVGATLGAKPRWHGS